MMRVSYMTSVIPKWEAVRVGEKDKWTYNCHLCGKELKSGDWVMVRNDNALLICAYEVPNAAS